GGGNLPCRRVRRRPVRFRDRRPASSPPPDLAGSIGRARSKGGSLPPSAVPPRGSPTDSADPDRRGGSGGSRKGGPSGRGADRFRQDRSGPSSRARRRPRERAAGGLPDLEDASAEDGGLRAHRDERAGVSHPPGA